MSYEYIDDFEPSVLDGENFLSEVPLSLLMEAIRNQMENPVEYRRKDYVQSFITKYEYSKEHASEDYVEELNEHYGTFAGFMRDILGEYFDVAFPELNNMPDMEGLDLLHMTYRFFIKNYKRNFVFFVLNYIEDQKDRFASDYANITKDSTYANYKSMITDVDDLRILCALPHIVKDCMEDLRSLTVEDFFRLVEETDSMETEYVADAYEKFLIVGNFVEPYAARVPEEFLYDIEAKVRRKILKKYSNRKRVPKTSGEENPSLDDENTSDDE